MREKYGTIAELLRHFYAILNTASTTTTTTAARGGGQSKTTISNAAGGGSGHGINEIGTRLDKLIQRLVMHKEILKRKIEHIDGTVVNRHNKLSCRAIVDDMTKLLERAENKWKDYQK